MEIEFSMVEKAYKKLKSSVYFDKTQLILRNAIVEFENNNFDQSLHKIYNALGDNDDFLKLQNDILNSISVSSYPKKLRKNKRSIILNSGSKKISVKELQHFINMRVEGHILGALWIMLIGYQIDKEVYKHSYGNRIRKNLINELSESPTYSPYLFEPYFVQYESWRDKALSEAQKYMDMGHDVAIITMDFKRYYYSVDADKAVFDNIIEIVREGENINALIEHMDILERLNNFVYAVIDNYSKKFGNEYNGLHILPIGFLPSNILGNWCLRNFDKAVVDGWNPVYYGRYVDDVLIVDKIEHNSDIYNKAKSEELQSDDIIEFFLTQCSRWKGNPCPCRDKENIALLNEVKKEQIEGNSTGDDRNPVYRINPTYNVMDGNKSKITVQNNKVKIFYFRSGESDALLTCFKERISKNKSEFRHLPEDEAVFQRDDYNEIYSLKSSESPNKLRGVDSVEIDKFELSKFLGKYLRVGGMIDNKLESSFERDILKIFDLRTIIENYTALEKVIEIFVIAERYDAVAKFVKRICESIESVEYLSDDSILTTNDVKKSLYCYLHSILIRTFALVWKSESSTVLNKIYSDNMPFMYNDWGDNRKDFLNTMRMAYCRTRMIDKSVLPINIALLSLKKLADDDIQVNLTRFMDVLPIVTEKWDNEYKYHPYLVNMYDFGIISFVEGLTEDGFSKYDEMLQNQLQNFIKTNYSVSESADFCQNNKKQIYVYQPNELPDDVFAVEVGDSKRSRLRLAVANVRLDYNNFKKVVEGTPNRSYNRYRELSFVVNQAIDQNADMLVMPEAYIPFEWLPILSRTCSQNGIAVITGVEHIKYDGKIFNFTAVILPYSSKDGIKCALISFHLKRHYAPHEKELINGYRLQEVKGNHYELYKWNGCYFPVYCCYELTSISDRALFQSYADLVIAVEWNKDVNYYSNILESLSRDVHCYCVQVNTSDYGDSRITRPAKTEEKDIIRTKGGMNSTVLIGDIDINELREFQLKEYSLQKGNKFKPTPPGFEPNIILKKIRGERL